MLRSRVRRFVGPRGLILASCVLTLMTASAFADGAPETAADVDSQADTKAATVITPSDADTPPSERDVVKVVPIEGEAPITADGLVVVRDQETGELRAPTSEERQAMAVTVDPLSRSAAGLEEVHYSDGSVSVDLDGRFQHATVVRREGDQLHMGCSHDAGTVHDMLTETETTEIKEEVRDDR